MYRTGYVYKYDANAFETYEEAEKQAKIYASGGREIVICKDVAHVLPEDSLTVVVTV